MHCWIQPLRLHFLLSLSSQFPEFSFLPARPSLLLLDLFVHQKVWLFCPLNLGSLAAWSFEATVVFSSCIVDTSDSPPSLCGLLTREKKTTQQKLVQDLFSFTLVIPIHLNSFLVNG